jgi:undecaprenyl-diphosphatase
LVAILIVFRSRIGDILIDTAKGLPYLLQRHSIQQIKDHAPLFPVAVAIIIGTIPAAFAGVFLEDSIQAVYEGRSVFVGIMLGITGTLLLSTYFISQGDRKEVRPLPGFVIGIAQAFALLPGISRSGITIVTGYFLGFSHQQAAEFSFLLAIPALAGAMGLKLIHLLTNSLDLQSLAAANRPGLLIGTITAFVTGWLSLRFLLNVVKKGKLYGFGFYCLPAGILIILLGT